MNFDSLRRVLDVFHTTRVLVIGDVMLDRFIYGTVDRISPEAPIPVLNVERLVDMPGGAANVARNIAAMGARAILIGVVGGDSSANDLNFQLASSPSIDARLIIDPARPTTIKTRYVADGQQVMRADLESCGDLVPAVESQILEQFELCVSEASVVILSDYAKGVLSHSVSRAVIDRARCAEKTVIVDPKSRSFAKYRGATIITPNRLELQRACGTECSNDDQVASGARQILSEGVCDMLVVTRGKDGMSVVSLDGDATHMPTAARQVFDVSGAGDTVVAAIALAVGASAGVGDAAAIANIAAGIVVGKRGTATVSGGEIMASLAVLDNQADPTKIFALESVLTLARSWRRHGLKIAFTNGCFDLLHPGHISLLDQARRSADKLIVGLNADLSIRRLKGLNRPIQSEAARATVLAAVKSVDAVVIFSEDTPMNLIQVLEPDVLVKGADYTLESVVGAKIVIERGGKILIAELLNGHSTTHTIGRVVA